MARSGSAQAAGVLAGLAGLRQAAELLAGPVDASRRQRVLELQWRCAARRAAAHGRTVERADDGGEPRAREVRRFLFLQADRTEVERAGGRAHQSPLWRVKLVSSATTSHSSALRQRGPPPMT